MNTPFLGGTYVSRSRNLAYSRCVNLYPEMIETGQGKEAGGFFSTPGLELVATIGPGPIRLIDSAPTNPTQCLVVSGNEVHVMDSSFVDLATFGTIGSSSGQVRAVTNPTQYLIVDGGGGYCLDGSTPVPTFAQVLPGDLGVMPVSVGYQDGFAFVNSYTPAATPLSQNWWQSDLNDFRVWEGLNFSSADGASDPVLAVFDLNRESWLFGNESIEVWINGGLPGFAFQRLQGVFMQVGIAAIYSLARVGPGVMWLAQDDQGDGVVMFATGYTPQRVSTHAIEEAIASYSRIDDAFAYCYQQEGHTFYVLTFPSGNATWVYDATPKTGGLWHERAVLIDGSFARQPVNCYGFFNGDHLVGDYQTGKIYRLNLDVYTDNGQPRKWLRSWPAFPQGKAPMKPTRFDSLSIDMQTGIAVPDGLNPQMTLRYSDDGGHNWSNELQAPMGQSGETAARTMWTRLGSTRQATGLNRLFEISSADPVPAALVGASMEASPA